MRDSKGAHSLNPPWVPSFGFRDSGFRFRVQHSRFRASGFGLKVQDFRFRVSGLGQRDQRRVIEGTRQVAPARVSGFGIRVSGFGFRVSNFGFRMSGFG